jgi:hypothetical protein
VTRLGTLAGSLRIPIPNVYERLYFYFRDIKLKENISDVNIRGCLGIMQNIVLLTYLMCALRSEMWLWYDEIGYPDVSSVAEVRRDILTYKRIIVVHATSTFPTFINSPKQSSVSYVSFWTPHMTVHQGQLIVRTCRL